MKAKYKKNLILFLLLFTSLTVYLISYFNKPIQNECYVKNAFFYPDKEPKDKEVNLLFFFHGAGCDQTLVLKPYSYGGLDLANSKIIYPKDLVIVSLGYNTKFHWSNLSTVKSTIQAIKKISHFYKTKKIYFVGISMGGSLVLNLISHLDAELQSKVDTAIAIMPIIDYKYTFQNTKRENILDDIKKEFFKCRNPYEQMQLSSPITHIKNISPNVKLLIVEGVKDTHVCSSQIEKYYSEAKIVNNKTALIKWDVDHSFFDIENDYRNLIFSLFL